MSEYQKSQTITGKAPPEAVVGFVVKPKEHPLREKVAMWYFKPLHDMKGHEAFICLAICFSLYEKYLRQTGAMPKEQEFSHDHKVFRLVAEQINTDPNTAYLIWNSWRNGLLHRAMPNEKDDVKWFLDGNLNVPVVIEGANITINPWRLRDRILDVVEAERDIWNDSEAPLMNVYEVTPLK
jgi:hypothetical protein